MNQKQTFLPIRKFLAQARAAERGEPPVPTELVAAVLLFLFTAMVAL